MCTVTYLPKAAGSFLLTNNRDEHISRRIASLPEQKRMHEVDILFPTDLQAGGTWISCSKQYTLCLLNGGLSKHERRTPYRHSRGLIPLDFYKYRNVDDFWNQYPLHDIEPFTLIVIDHEIKRIHQLIHDVSGKYHRRPDPDQAHIWSSTTLYSDVDRVKRETWFKNWLSDHPEFAQADIIEFHKQKFDELDSEGIHINRNETLKTVSLTSVFASSPERSSMYYEDFITNQNKLIHLE